MPKEGITRSEASTAPASYNVVDHVMATLKDSYMYPGLVEEVRGNMYLIRWEDGDEPIRVAKDEMLPFSQAQARHWDTSVVATTTAH